MPNKILLQDAWSGVADCRNCKLRDGVLFAGLTEADFEKIHEPITQATLKPGQALYRTGEPGGYLFTLRTGLIKLQRYLPDGTQRIVRLIRPSDVVGLEIVLGSQYEHDAIALDNCELCCLPVNVVRELSSSNAQLQQELLGRWQRALNDADRWLTELATGSAKQRVARLLLNLSEEATTGDCPLFSREDIGAMLGITTETASRTIAEFKRQSLLQETGDHKGKVNREALQALLES